jgi:hypothetical protein
MQPRGTQFRSVVTPHLSRLHCSSPTNPAVRGIKPSVIASRTTPSSQKCVRIVSGTTRSSQTYVHIVSLDYSQFENQRSHRSLENSEFSNTQCNCNFGNSIMGNPTVAASVFELSDTSFAWGSFAGELQLQRNTGRSLFGLLEVVQYTFT